MELCFGLLLCFSRVVRGLREHGERGPQHCQLDIYPSEDNPLRVVPELESSEPNSDDPCILPPNMDGGDNFNRYNQAETIEVEESA